LEFETTENVLPLQGIIGQERAVKATEFALRIKRSGYNLFMSGLTGTGKTRYVQSKLKEFAQNESTPEDICYVYNFKIPSQPICIMLPCGQGIEFKKDMEELVDDLQTSITKVFAGDEYEEQKNQLIKKFSNEKQKMLQELHRFAEEKGFILKYANSGYVSIPVLEGKQINADEYDNLDVEIKEKIEKNSLEVQEKAIEVLKQIQQIEKNAKEKIKNLQDETALFAIGHLIKNLQDKYSKNEKIIKYLENVQNDILCNLETFMETEEDEKFPLPWFKKGGKEGILLKYKVNVLVDNSEWKGAPVIFEFNPTYHNLIGRIEYVNELGVITTDYTKIKPGALHKANGGYLVLQAKDVLTNPFAWDGLKRVLKTQELTIEDLREQFGAVSISSLKPEPIKINVKIILLGNPYLYHLLYNLDEDFRKLFKIKADFDSEMDLNRIHMEKMAAFISSHCQQENIKHFDRTGIAKVIEYSTRLAGNQNKLTTRFNELVEILYEADAYARFDESQYVTAKHVEQAIREKKFRSNKYEEKIHEMFEQGKILITIEGKVVGQINGLAVVNLGDYSFGKPNRITAATYMGRSGVINIEREIRMSGSIHDKGLLILTGFLGEKFAQERPLALSASLCFEQLYGGIEGDSASSTELYALLSSLADVPIYQGIAVTGSVNQKGEIQPVGGVTEKIEGFFKICKQKGLTGEQGVIIPKQNVSDLVLDEEVVEAVKNKQFNIYAVDNIDQGIEILTGIPAGEKDKNGKYPEGSINYLVEQKLNKYLKSFLEIKKEYSSEEPA
jgi:lon-related putative ATP-dependent protease